MRKVGRVELIDGFDHSLQKPAGGRVIHRFIDGDDVDAVLPEQGFVYDGILPISGEPRQFPHQDGAESIGVLPSSPNHGLEPGAVDRPATLRLVYILPNCLVAVSVRVFPKGFELGCDGKIHDLISCAGNLEATTLTCTLMFWTKVRT
ncbi:MAG: hypothetical protein IIB89_04620 [Chloroflexi bacterium]|nr:hypothetical protein [Chloroflexota bacterium]